MDRHKLHNELTIIITTTFFSSHSSSKLLNNTIFSFSLVESLDDCEKCNRKYKI